MSLINFKSDSVTQLRAILGSYGDNQIGSALKTSAPYVETRWFRVTEEVTTEEEEPTTEYKAEEILPDGTVLEDGIKFDSDGTNTYKPADPVYLNNLLINAELFSGSVELDKAYQVEAVWPKTYGEDPVYYIIPQGSGGGSSDFRLKIGGTGTIGKNIIIAGGADVVDYNNSVIVASVDIIQNVFDTAKIYSGEILYGYINEDGVYAIDKSLLGV